MRKHAFEDGDVVKLESGAVGIYSGDDWLGLAAPAGKVWVVIDGDVAAIDPAEISKFGGVMESKTAGYIAWEPLGSGFRGGYHDGNDWTGWIAKVEEHSLDGTYLYHIFAPGDGTRDYGPHAGGAYTGFATEQRAMDDALEQIERWISNGVTGSRQRNGMRTEAEIVRDLQRAEGLAEQRELVRELDLFRQGRTAAVQADRDTDIANAFIRDTLTPVLPYQHHTAATDWIEEEAVSGPYDHQMRVEATMWFKRVSAEVKADHEEFGEQAQGMARRVSGQFGLQAEAAYFAFLETVARLYRQADDKPGEVDDDQSGNAESAVTDYDTDADQEPFLGEDWEDKETGVHPPMPGAGEGGGGVVPHPQYDTGIRPGGSRRRALHVGDPWHESYCGALVNEPCDCGLYEEYPELAPTASLHKRADVSCSNCGHDSYDHEGGACTECDCGQFTSEDSIEAGASLRKQARPLYEIADEIRADWTNVYFGAVPYLDALSSMDSIKDPYGYDSGDSIVAYFLSNATTWRGEKAREIKAELNKMLKGGSLQKRAEWDPAVGDRVEVPNPEGETMFDQMETGTITSVDGAYFNVQLDSGEQSPYSWVVEDGVHLIEGSLRKRADTCSKCGDSIERDPEGEEPRTYHHTSGGSHDHEAEPGGEGESKESVLRVAMNGTVRPATVRAKSTWTSVSLRGGGVSDITKGDVLTGWLNEYGNFYDSNEVYVGSIGTQFEEVEGTTTARRRTAGVYCNTHQVWVGEGNADTHENCSKEQKATEKTKDARRRQAAGYDPSKGVYDDSRWQYVNEQGTGMGWFSDEEKAEAANDPELAGGSWKEVTEDERGEMNRWYNEQVYLQSSRRASGPGKGRGGQAAPSRGGRKTATFRAMIRANGGSNFWEAFTSDDYDDLVSQIEGAHQQGKTEWRIESLSPSGRWVSDGMSYIPFSSSNAPKAQGSRRKTAESFGLVNGKGEFLVDTETGGIRVTKSEVNAGRFNRPTADSLVASVQNQMGGEWEVISLSGSRRKTGVSLTNIGIVERGPVGAIFKGTDPEGNEVQFRANQEDTDKLMFVLFGDLAQNFTGVDVDQVDIVTVGSRRTAAYGKPGQTTLSVDYSHRPSWGKFPTKDVTILPDVQHCSKCGKVTRYEPGKDMYGFGGKHFHADGSESDHFVSPRVKCDYCNNDDPGSVRYRQHAWHDSVECDRCGGAWGRGIGD